MLRRAITTQLQKKGYVIVADGVPATFNVRSSCSESSADKYAATGGGVSGHRSRGTERIRQDEDTPLGALPPPDGHQHHLRSLAGGRAMGRTAWRGILEGEPKGDAPSEARITTLVAEV